jgi:hypothetical protein
MAGNSMRGPLGALATGGGDGARVAQAATKNTKAQSGTT